MLILLSRSHPILRVLCLPCPFTNFGQIYLGLYSVPCPITVIYTGREDTLISFISHILLEYLGGVGSP
jgi:hypothetical protein